MKRYKEIHIWNRKGEYVGNIIFKYTIPVLSEEEFMDLILEHFPKLKGESWKTKFI